MRTLLIVIFVSLKLIAQDNYYFEHYSLEKGLSQGSGYAVSQYDNYMWFGTQDGLNRFDGYRFDVFRSNNKIGVNDNFIQCFLTDKDQNFWVATVKGICLYNKNLGGFQVFDKYFSLKHKLSSISVRNMIQDDTGNIWLISDEEGLFCFNTKTKAIKQYFQNANNFIEFTKSPSGKLFVLSDNEVQEYQPEKDSFKALNILSSLNTNKSNVLRTIVIDQENKLWIGTYDEGLYILSENLKVLKHYLKGSSDQNLSSNEIKCTLKDSQNRIWIGTRNGGISLFNPYSKKIIKINHNSLESKSLSKNYVLSFFEDKQQNIWVGLSGGGFDKFDPRKYPFQNIRHIENSPSKSIGDNMVFKIFAQDKFMYFGTQAGGLSKFDTLNGTFKSFKPEPNNPNSIIHSEVYDISADKFKNLWLATGRGLCQYFPNTDKFITYLPNSTERSLYLYAAQVLKNNQELWAGGQRGLFRFDMIKKQWVNWSGHPSIEKISKYVIRLIYEDSNANIWLGTLGHGILKYDTKTKTLSQIDEKSGLDCANIRSFYQQGNHIWVGTDCGLYQINTINNKILNKFNTENGLVNNVIYGVLEDKKNSLWLSSNKGIMNFDVSNNSVKSYSIFDGLTSNEFNTNCVYKTKSGKFYFGGIAGVNYFKASDLKINLYSPAPKFTKIKVLDSLYILDQKNINLNYKQNFVDFEYSSFNFSNTESITYEHQLTGIDEKWVSDGLKNNATYTNLPPGDYQFKVRSKNADDIVSSDILSVQINIKPPFWKTYWFRFLMFGVLSVMTFYLFKLRIKQIEARESRKTEIQHIRSQAEMIALKAQINPHFIFNCLNTVDSYVLSNQKKAASNFLQTFSQLIRLVLENSSEELVPFQKDIESLKLYTSLEEERFGHDFKTIFEIDPEIIARNLKTPPMLFQPFIENAILHGLRHQNIENKTLLIKADILDDSVQIIIRDNGIGIEASKEINSKRFLKHKSKGLSLTINRIKALGEFYDKPTFYEVIDLKTGTEIRIKIPTIS